jgi:hypothetical protein
MRTLKVIKIKLCLVLVMLLSSNLVSANDWDNPSTPFDTKKNYTNHSHIQWMTVDNVQASCEKESHNRGYGGFNIAVQACSFYKGDQCVIITGKKSTMHQLGHEVRHCFQADWHR